MIRDYLNRGFTTDKLLKLLVKYHSINESIGSLKKRIKKNAVSKMKPVMRTETSWMDQSPTEAGTHSGRTKRFGIHRIEDQCKEKVGRRFHQIIVQS